MNTQRLRNLTTCVLHTEMKHIYEDLERMTGISPLSTHMLPNALDALNPWLEKHVTEPVFWEEKLNLDHDGDTYIPRTSAQDKKEIQQRYLKLASK